MIDNDKLYYSEIFASQQGEGTYTGVNTIWLRVFGCNFKCQGFGQKDPTDPSTYDLPYERVNPDDYDRLEDLPVFERGCDSSYSWSPKFLPLVHNGTPDEVAQKLIDKNKTNTNPDGLFVHPISKNPIHLCFTGGEPLMPGHQKAIGKILKYITDKVGHIPSMTFETNTTYTIGDELFETFNELTYEGKLGEIFFSSSPKLLNVSGERDRIKPDVAQHYSRLHDHFRSSYAVKGHFKFVVRDTPECWNELQDAVDNFRAAGVNWPVWLMNCGGTSDGQLGAIEGHNDEKSIAIKARELGYNYSTRAHIWIYGNAIGT